MWLYVCCSVDTLEVCWIGFRQDTFCHVYERKGKIICPKWVISWNKSLNSSPLLYSPARGGFEQIGVSPIPRGNTWLKALSYLSATSNTWFPWRKLSPGPVLYSWLPLCTPLHHKLFPWCFYHCLEILRAKVFYQLGGVCGVQKDKELVAE